MTKGSKSRHSPPGQPNNVKVNIRILITGTSGRIGSAIAGFLKNKEEVIGLDNKVGSYTISQK